MGFLQYSPLTLWAGPMGTAIEAILLSFALADRIKILQGEKEEAERRYLASIEQTAEQLELKVKDRTTQLEQAKLSAEHIARTDGLTGLNNRRAFYERGEDEFARTKRYGSPLTLVMLDIDHFKNINDTWGHAAGDEALRKIAEAITALLRETDFCGRVGGEEFGLLLPQTNREAGVALANRLRKRIHEIVIRHNEATINCSASFGVATCKSTTTNIDTLVASADRALYQAKQTGRNKVVEA